MPQTYLSLWCSIRVIQIANVICLCPSRVERCTGSRSVAFPNTSSVACPDRTTPASACQLAPVRELVEPENNCPSWIRSRQVPEPGTATKANKTNSTRKERCWGYTLPRYHKLIPMAERTPRHCPHASLHQGADIKDSNKLVKPRHCFQLLAQHDQMMRERRPETRRVPYQNVAFLNCCRGLP